MKIGVIQASSQKDKNELLYECAKTAAKGHEVINFGCFAEDTEEYSYIEIALEAGLLLSSGAVDFIVTGCSSGQGMMLALGSMPGVVCGMAENPQDAFLFGRINGGNAISIPLGLGFGWCGEINLSLTLEKLFDGGFGTGYPERDAQRKRRDTEKLKMINGIAKVQSRDFLSRLEQNDPELLKKALARKPFSRYILNYGKDSDITEYVRSVERL